jgi:low affinity Fe/Cu permease
VNEQLAVKPVQSTALRRGFASVADRIAHILGQPLAFIGLSLVIAVWVSAILLYPRLGWQPLENTIAVVTFLMVLLVQSNQNRNATAVQVKLDELIRALETAENKFMGIEKLTVEEVHELREEIAEGVADEVEQDIAAGRVYPLPSP